jgi:histidyl-tRNA synthetase
MTRSFRALRGTKDVLPADTPRWQHLERTVREVCGRYAFREIRTPLIEATELFARSVGEGSDIVRKEMYRFDAGGESICLRPEATAGVVRAFVEHALHRHVGEGFPARYFYMGPMFRYERPQKGRQRQFHQIGVEVLGAAEPLADAETIQMACALLDELGASERELVLNSVGDAECRPRYRERLRSWLEPRMGDLCEDCRRRNEENPLRVFDCKVERDRAILAAAPALGDCLCDGCRRHLEGVREALARYGLAHRIEPRIVRGLDYYVRTVFEILSPALGAQNAILGGGRYDGLVQELGGPALPGFGFAAGMERLLLVGAEPPAPSAVDVALIALGGDAVGPVAALAGRLRARGLRCTAPVAERPMGAQVRRASREGARFALFVGDEELRSGRFGLKDLESGAQESLGEEAIASRVKAVTS